MIKFPIYKNDHKPFLQVSERQKNALNQVMKKIDSGHYVRHKNKCFCQSLEKSKGLLLSEKDFFGIPLRSILCKKTGLICSEFVFDQVSNNSFYSSEYRDLASFHKNAEGFFEVQIKRGQQFQKLLHSHISKDYGKLEVADIGCGAGGVLYPFFQAIVY